MNLVGLQALLVASATPNVMASDGETPLTHSLRVGNTTVLPNPIPLPNPQSYQPIASQTHHPATANFGGLARHSLAKAASTNHL